MMRRSAGYTILEAMIFLAVSAVLFALVIPAYSNQQDKIRFSQTARDMESKINDIVNDVSAGYFPGDEVKCVPGPTDIAFSEPDVTHTETQGTREACIFVGKNMIFSNLPDSTSKIDIDTYVGRRKNLSGRRVSSLTEATPAPVKTPDLTEIYNLGPVAKIDCVYELPDPTSGGICDTSAVKTEIGAYIALSSIDSTKTLDIYKDHTFTTRNPEKGIIICLRDTKTDQQAAILVGGIAGIAKTKLVFDKVNIDSTYGGGVCG